MRLIKLWSKTANDDIFIPMDRIILVSPVSGPHSGTNITVEGLAQSVWVQETPAEINRIIEAANA